MQRSRRGRKQDVIDKSSVTRRQYRITFLCLAAWIICILLNSQLGLGDDACQGDENGKTSFLHVKHEETEAGDQEQKQGTARYCKASDFFPFDVNRASLFCMYDYDEEKPANIEPAQTVVAKQKNFVSGEGRLESPATARASRVTCVGLEEFKKKSSDEKDRTLDRRVATITHRREPGGGAYNYAAASKGAKTQVDVLPKSNKLAKIPQIHPPLVETLISAPNSALSFESNYKVIRWPKLMILILIWGHYVPQLAQVIYRHNNDLANPVISLKGYMVGNAVTNDFHDRIGIFEYMWSHGLISDNTYRKLNIFCDFSSLVHPSHLCEVALDHADSEMGKIDPYSIFTPPCLNTTVNGGKQRGERNPWRLFGEYDPCTERHSEIYFNQPEVQKALHANVTGLPYRWSTCRSKVIKSVYNGLFGGELRASWNNGAATTSLCLPGSLL